MSYTCAQQGRHGKQTTIAVTANDAPTHSTTLLTTKSDIEIYLWGSGSQQGRQNHICGRKQTLAEKSLSE